MHFTHRTSYLACLIALSAALAACSGGTTDNTPTPAPTPPSPSPAPTPPGSISLNFRNPTQNVYDQGSSNNTLSVEVRKDNVSADNITVVFSTTPGTASPVSTQSTGGIAWTTLSVPSLAPTGAMSITATTAGPNAVFAPFSAYVRPHPEPLQVLVPAYFSADKDSATWTALTNGVLSYPDVPLSVIVKPDNATSGTIAAGTYTPDAKLITTIATLKAANPSIKVLGYVATGGGSSGTISLVDIKTTIDQYASAYGTSIDGFYLDGMSTDFSRVAAFYQPLAAHIRATAGMATTPPVVVGNPATYPDRAYASVADVLVTFNGSATDYLRADPQSTNAAWVYDRKNSAQAMQVHTAGTCSDMQAAVARANTARMNTGWVFVTDQTVGSPWATLPATVYWKSFLGTVDATNKRNPLPTC